MKDFKRSGGFGGDRGGRRDFGGKPSFGGGNFSRGGDRGGDRRPDMHKATCAECSKSCEVPFRPTGDKPVYCKDCFTTMRGEEDRGGHKDFGNRGPRKDFGDRGGKRDWNDKPAPRADFSRPAPSNDDTKKQLSEISMKLDRLVSAMEKLTQAKNETPVEKVVTKKPTTLKSVVKKAVASKKTAKKK